MVDSHFYQRNILTGYFFNFIFNFKTPFHRHVSRCWFYFESVDRNRLAAAVLAVRGAVTAAAAAAAAALRERSAELESARSEMWRWNPTEQHCCCNWSLFLWKTTQHRPQAHTATTGTLYLDLCIFFFFLIHNHWEISSFIFYFSYTFFFCLSLSFWLSLPEIDWKQWGASFFFFFFLFFSFFFFTSTGFTLILLFVRFSVSVLMTQCGRSEVLREDLLSLYGIIVDGGALL